jgi:hypothetical protein
MSIIQRDSRMKWVKTSVWLPTCLFGAAIVSVALAVAPTPSGVAQEASSAAIVAHVIDREKSSWTALQRHDKQAWGSILSDTYSHVNSRGIRMNRAEVLNKFPDEAVDGYSLHDVRGTLLCPGVVLLVYWFERTSRFTGAFTSTAIWVNRSGNWRRLQYQETPISPSPAYPEDATLSPLPGRRDS